MAYYAIDGTIGVDFTETTTAQKWPLGMEVQANDDTRGQGRFKYLLGLASTAVGEWVHYNADDFSTTLAVADGIGPIAVAMSANVASQYGWYQITGKASGLAAASYADNGNVYLTATAGTVDDAAVAGDLVHKAKGASAVATATGLADFEIDRPWSDNDVDDLDT